MVATTALSGLMSSPLSSEYTLAFGQLYSSKKHRINTHMYMSCSFTSICFNAQDVQTHQMLTNWQTWQFFVTFLGRISDLLERLSDLQLGDEKVTLNHLGASVRQSSALVNTEREPPNKRS